MITTTYNPAKQQIAVTSGPDQPTGEWFDRYSVIGPFLTGEGDWITWDHGDEDGDGAEAGRFDNFNDARDLQQELLYS